MQNPRSDLWVPDTRPENVSTFTESYTPTGGQEQTATYKAIPNHTIIGGILNKLSFGWGHAKATWYNKLAGKTVKDKFDETDTAIQDLSVKLEGRIGGITNPKTVVFNPTQQTTIINPIQINDACIVFNNCRITQALSVTIKISGVTYYVLGKIDNANPFRLRTLSGVKTSVFVYLHGSAGYSLNTITELSIRYDGTNTYLCVLSPFAIPESYIDSFFIPITHVLYNSCSNESM
ncbi:MAG: hypothetical protein HFI31_14240 [Lachnospiraceae bacterium]|nr:hypothetical protein [Lachnospiraceae bacterium]